jgi:hypothetical protein
MIDLFPQNKVVGVFRGFREGGMEFHADITLPYDDRLQDMPMHGQFVLGQLESPEEAILGRITAISADGKLTSSAGEQYAIRSVSDGREVPSNLKEAYLKYRIDIRILGVLRYDSSEQGLVFVPSHRRLPHVGSQVAFLSDEVLSHVAGHQGTGAEIGHFALGEYIYAEGDERLTQSPWMRPTAPAITVKFAIENLVSRRSFIFARAGFGKSNLNKLLFSTLYRKTPTVLKRGNKKVPVGTVIFDPDGEYFWPDDKGRPGLCDVPHLRDKLVVFTSRGAPSDFYGSFVSGGVKLDIRRFRPSDIISIALPGEKQDQQNVRKLRGLNFSDWSDMVDLIDGHGNGADIDSVRRILRLEAGQEVEAFAARANMTSIVRMLHDKSSTLMDDLLSALTDGKLCVVDVSQLRGGPSLVLSGLILRRIFDRNQDEFTKAEPRTIPTIAVVEEAQSVLNDKNAAAAPYVEWVKEGRKYDLGAVLVTQQPGSISNEILSQGDNWFVFHLLSAGDLSSVKAANSHFSKDLLSSLLNEPIPGQGVFWSSAGVTPYPIPFRGLLFESMYETIDPYYDKPAANTAAANLRERRDESVAKLVRESVKDGVAKVTTDQSAPGERIDVLTLQKEKAIREVAEDPEVRDELEQGIAWGKLKALILDRLPESMDDRDTVAYHLVPRVATEIAGGEQDTAWTTEKRARGANQVTYIVRTP